ncbi:MAG: Cof-type HAD-IIB family hydrolase [Bacillota bacterium]|jgi:Cof subfamily protein (haloacid dehalogenase superfamily)
MREKLLLALDLDGTLLTSKLEISPLTRKRLKEFQDRGHLVTFATGRPYRGALRFAVELDLKLPLILNNGALVADAEGNEHSVYPVDPQVGVELLAYCRTHGLPCSFYIGNDIYMLMPNPLAEELHRSHDHTVPQLAENPEELLPRGVINYAIIMEPHQIDLAYPQLKARFADSLEIARSGSRFIDIFQAGVSKGRALRDLGASLGIEKKNIIAAGDNHNDLEMLKAAGLGVAMAGADELVKSAADYVTAGNDQDGIAALLEAILACGNHLSLIGKNK